MILRGRTGYNHVFSSSEKKILFPGHSFLNKLQKNEKSSLSKNHFILNHGQISFKLEVFLIK